MKKTIIVFGATGYVGRFLVGKLLEQEYHVIAVGRNKVQAEILLYDFFARIEFAGADEILQEGRFASLQAEAVINLAYIQDAPFEKLFRTNKMLSESVHRVAVKVRAARLIHTSTVSVFGYSVPAQTPPQPVPMQWGDPYIETKIAAEKHFLQNRQKGNYSLAIVRLGNVLGPGSPGWTAGIASKLMLNKPAGFTGENGYANATYVRNIADYFCFLASLPDEELNRFGTFHHLAEFSGERWNTILGAYAEAIGMPLRFTERFAVPAPPPFSMKRKAVSFAGKFLSGKKSGYARYWSSRFSNIGPVGRTIGKIKKARAGNFRLDPSPALTGELSFLQTMSEPNRFETHLVPGWKAPVDFETALREMQDDLRDSLFCYSGS